MVERYKRVGYLEESKGTLLKNENDAWLFNDVPKAPTHVCGRPLYSAAHRADFLRLEILHQFGGIYLVKFLVHHVPFALNPKMIRTWMFSS
jgi:hypothetical protein